MENIVVAILIAAVLFLFFMTASCLIDYGYKKGQVDAINGVIKYELVENSDGSKEWQKIEEK